MRSLIFLVLFATTAGLAQTRIDKSVPVWAGQRLILNFDFPNVKLQTWDKSEIQVTGTASINRGEHDEAFYLDVASQSDAVTITSMLRDKENIPERILIKRGEQEYFFKTANYNDAEVQKFLSENGGDYRYRSTGVHQDIALTVFVPRNTSVEVIATHGLIEARAFDAPLKVTSKHGSIDITFTQPVRMGIVARCQYGEILTNLDVKFERASDGGKNGKRWTEISSGPGSGPHHILESKYGNIYLRKSE
jgi:hypothetical protein